MSLRGTTVLFAQPRMGRMRHPAHRGYRPNSASLDGWYEGSTFEDGSDGREMLARGEYGGDIAVAKEGAAFGSDEPIGTSYQDDEGAGRQTEIHDSFAVGGGSGANRQFDQFLVGEFGWIELDREGWTSSED